MQAVSPTRSRPSTSQVRPVCTLVHLLVHLRPLGEALARVGGVPGPRLPRCMRVGCPPRTRSSRRRH
jgi:hypothetical protein